MNPEARKEWEESIAEAYGRGLVDGGCIVAMVIVLVWMVVS